MRQKKVTYLTVSAIVVLALWYLIFFKSVTKTVLPAIQTDQTPTQKYTQDTTITQDDGYENKKYGMSFKIPKGYFVSEWEPENRPFVASFTDQKDAVGESPLALRSGNIMINVSLANNRLKDPSYEVSNTLSEFNNKNKYEWRGVMFEKLSKVDIEGFSGYIYRSLGNFPTVNAILKHDDTTIVIRAHSGSKSSELYTKQLKILQDVVGSVVLQ